MGRIQELFEKTVLDKSGQAQLQGLARYTAKELEDRASYRRALADEDVRYGLTRGNIARITNTPLEYVNPERMSNRMLWELGENQRVAQKNLIYNARHGKLKVDPEEAAKWTQWNK